MQSPLLYVSGQSKLVLCSLYHILEVSLPETQTYLIVYVKYLSSVPFTPEEPLIHEVDKQLEEYGLCQCVQRFMILHERLVLVYDCLEIEHGRLL